jgi:hypothetical protein
MTDLELLFLVLAIIYVWECGWWAKCGSVGLRAWLGSHWKIALPSRLLGNQGGGMIFASPLPPLGSLLVGYHFPASISAEGLLAFIPPSIDPARRIAASGQFLRFEAIQRVVADGKRVRINNQVILMAATPEFAIDLADQIERLHKLPITDRKRAIEQGIEQSFDLKEIEQRWNEFQVETQGLRLNTNFLFLYLFGILPLVLWRLGLSATWPWLLTGLLVCTLTIALQFGRTHKRLYPKAEDERFTHFIILFLSPASAVRARDVLTRSLLEKFHPVALARTFCSDQAFEALAEQVLRELRYPALPVCPHPDPLAHAAERYAREFQLQTLEHFLRRNGCRPENLVKPPPVADLSAKSFCPRCHAQFTMLEGSCQDCGGIQIIPFTADAPTASPKVERGRRRAVPKGRSA